MEVRISHKTDADNNDVNFGGGGWIRTNEAVRQQIYSLSHLTALELLHVELAIGLEPTTC